MNAGGPSQPGASALVIDGTAFPRSRDGLQQAIASLPSVGGDIIWPAGEPVEFDGTSITFPRGGVRLWFSSRGPIRVAEGSTADVFTISGTATSSAALVADVEAGASRIQLEPGGVAALHLRTGSYLYIEDALSLQSHLTVVVGLVGDAVAFRDLLTDPFTVAQQSRAYRLDMVEGIEIHGLHIAGRPESNALALSAAHVAGCHFEVHAENFGDSGAVSITRAYDSLITGSATQCGSVDQAAVNLSHFGRIGVERLTINGGGFGFGAQFGNYFTFREVRTSFTKGRGIKIGGSVGGSQCAEGVLIACEANYAREADSEQGTPEDRGYTGLCYTFGSHDIQELGCRAHGNASSGWWTSGSFEHNITVIGGSYYHNGWLDGASDIAVSNINNGGMRFLGTRYGTKTDYAADTLWDSEPHGTRQHQPVSTEAFIPIGAFGGRRPAADDSAAKFDCEILVHGADRSLVLNWQVPADWAGGDIGLYPVYTATGDGAGSWICTFSFRPVATGDFLSSGAGEAATEMILELFAQGVLADNVALPMPLQPSAPGQFVRLTLGRHGTHEADSDVPVGILGLKCTYEAAR